MERKDESSFYNVAKIAFVNRKVVNQQPILLVYMADSILQYYIHLLANICIVPILEL